MKYTTGIARLATGSLFGVLNQETFVVKTVRDLLWGYNDTLIKLAKDMMPADRVIPHDKFGFFVGVSFPLFLGWFPSASILIGRNDFCDVNNRKMRVWRLESSPYSPAEIRPRCTVSSTTGTASTAWIGGRRRSATPSKERTVQPSLRVSLPTQFWTSTSRICAAAFRSSTRKMSATEASKVTHNRPIISFLSNRFSVDRFLYCLS